MFYFGGMTLGYLTPPDRKTGDKQSRIVAEARQDDLPCVPADQATDNRGLIARSNWFGLNG